jgi:methylase of polypeptide subunit release factors
VELSKRFGTVAGTDIVRPSMADWRDGASYFLADRASCIKSSTFDLVFFNPPYLAEEGAKDVAVEGGRGLEVPRSFLREALRVVRRNGAVVFLLDDTAELQGLERVCSGSGFSLRRVGGRRLFYEGLAVYEARHGV